jgi:hypothetical protein
MVIPTTSLSFLVVPGEDRLTEIDGHRRSGLSNRDVEHISFLVVVPTQALRLL